MCAIGAEEAHAPRARNLTQSRCRVPGQAQLGLVHGLSARGSEPSSSRLAELGAMARWAPVPISNWGQDAFPETSPAINFDRWDTDAEGDWLP